MHCARSFLRQGVFVVLSTVLFSSCGERDQPPYFTALVTNVYREECTVHNFNMLYWWEERGDTPFLKPYTLRTKEIIVEIAIPFKDDPRRITLETRHIPFSSVTTIDCVLTDAGKDIVVTLKSGETITATNRFPRSLKKGTDTGFADFKIFAVGHTREGGSEQEFKTELNLIKTIRILGATSS